MMLQHQQKTHSNEFSYEAMGHMHYLDQVVAETLRKYPLTDLLMRHALNDYHIPGTAYNIERGTCLLVPVYAIHHDAAIYPKPQKFQPNRFDAASVMARHSCAYLSFDDGPRNCLGKRLCKMLVKVAVVLLLREYELVTMERVSEAAVEPTEGVEDEMFYQSTFNVVKLEKVGKI